MNRKTFFDAMRTSLFSGRLNQEQVRGTEAILGEWERRGLSDLRHLAYMLATAFHETGFTMQPISEKGGPAYFKRMYDKAGARPKKAKELGNTQAGDGARFHGRGFVQLTGRINYARASAVIGADLVADPDLAMDKRIAAEVMFHGMKNGWFTGKKLADYFTGKLTDWVNARRIINGTDKAALIAGYAQKFHAALKAAA